MCLYQRFPHFTGWYVQVSVQTYHCIMVKEFDAFDRDEEFKSHFALPSIEILELFS